MLYPRKHGLTQCVLKVEPQSATLANIGQHLLFAVSVLRLHVRPTQQTQY